MPKGRQPNPNIEIRGIGEGISGERLSQLGAAPTVPSTKTNRELRTRGQNAANNSFTMEVWKISQAAKQTDNVALLRDAFAQYMALCDEYGFQPGNMGAYKAIGINGKTAKLWAAGKAGREKAELIRDINDVLSTSREVYILNGSMSPQVGMFMMKNFDGLSDQPIEIAEERDLLGDKPNAEDIINRYESLPDEE